MLVNIICMLNSLRYYCYENQNFIFKIYLNQYQGEKLYQSETSNKEVKYFVEVII